MSKILIIEDEVAIAELQRDYLEMNGFEVAVCGDGALGAKEALDNDYDLVMKYAGPFVSRKIFPSLW